MESGPATEGGPSMAGEAHGVGRTEEVLDRASPALASAMLATLDRDPSALSRGDPLPPLFHWMYCRELAPGSQLDVDGHQKRGDFLPALPLSRRMWAGGRLKFEGTVRVGDGLRRRSTVLSVTPKAGRSGPLVLVTVEHRILGHDGEIVEEQDLVFLERPAEPLVLPDVPAANEEMEWSESVTPNAAMLFRFSALTFNAHRIHYDRTYARDVEMYPDLVVHGPLTALLLADLAVRRSGRPLRTLSFRARRPMFVDRTIALQGRREGDRADLRALDETGALAMSAQATLA
ncbi:MAG: MaoC family dehydratase N-terminal domain-containing protein [Gemmatimonadota bacterium]|uniref:FAS1-like dehydratase domain-containing protein n=1 Tax=Candidatus Palauibacter scopulicola TaxID=3056741 RepID=UPI0023929D01|nr:MaoC family dehydratase N-terminal domain-containing protein [Candidatus Palauibacter scopulicola]MDE2663116.1 MaoC family dehydratase N-terminal domain-containing protein [Candidatus Palauibacter scopulicola]